MPFWLLIHDTYRFFLLFFALSFQLKKILFIVITKNVPFVFDWVHHCCVFGELNSIYLRNCLDRVHPHITTTVLISCQVQGCHTTKMHDRTDTHLTVNIFAICFWRWHRLKKNIAINLRNLFFFEAEEIEYSYQDNADGTICNSQEGEVNSCFRYELGIHLSFGRHA